MIASLVSRKQFKYPSAYKTWQITRRKVIRYNVKRINQDMQTIITYAESTNSTTEKKAVEPPLVKKGDYMQDIYVVGWISVNQHKICKTLAIIAGGSQEKCVWVQ